MKVARLLRGKGRAFGTQEACTDRRPREAESGAITAENGSQRDVWKATQCLRPRAPRAPATPKKRTQGLFVHVYTLRTKT